ncbi:MAG: hypothetical protein AAGG68_05400 [Bacteroidota bacterium]
MEKSFKYYRSLVLLFIPAILFILLIIFYRYHSSLQITNTFPYLPWQFWAIGLFGIVATIGGVLDWRFHRDPLKLKISKKEREAEAAALGLGGVPMFVLMSVATVSSYTQVLLIPIIAVLIYTTAAICYDEFVFHINRCGKEETLYHRLLVFGNGIAWLAWFHFIYV